MWQGCLAKQRVISVSKLKLTPRNCPIPKETVGVWGFFETGKMRLQTLSAERPPSLTATDLDLHRIWKRAPVTAGDETDETANPRGPKLRSQGLPKTIRDLFSSFSPQKKKHQQLILFFSQRLEAIPSIKIHQNPSKMARNHPFPLGFPGGNRLLQFRCLLGGLHPSCRGIFHGAHREENPIAELCAPRMVKNMCGAQKD